MKIRYRWLRISGCVLLGLSNHHDQKRSGLLSPRRSAAWLGRRPFSVLGGGKKDLLRLGIESHRLRSGLSRDRSRVFVNVRRLLAVDAYGSSPARKEDQLGVRIETRIVHTHADRIAVDYLPGNSVHDDHLRLVTAADEEAVRLRVISQTRRSLRHTDRKTFLDFQGFRIERDYFGGVLEVDINDVISNHCLFAIAFRLHRSYHFACLGIDGGDVVRAVVVGEHAFRFGIVVDAVRPLADVDLLDKCQGRRVEHRDLVLAAIAGEAVFESRGDRGPMDAGSICDRADEFATVRVQNFDLSRMRNVEPPRRTVDRDVIKAAGAANRVMARDLIAGRALKEQGAEK